MPGEGFRPVRAKMAQKFRRRKLRNACTVAAGLILLFCQGLSFADEDIQRAIRAEVELLRDTGQLSVGGIQIGAASLVAEVYERRGFAAAWDEAEKIQSLLTAVRGTYQDGLDPADYHLESIRELRQRLSDGPVLTLRDRAVSDLMLTDSLIRLTYHQRFGKVSLESRDSASLFARSLDGTDAATTIEDIIQSGSAAAAIQSIIPRAVDYRRLKSQLEHYRALADEGGWPNVSNGPTIRPGAADSRLGVLARRLAISGDLTEPVDTITEFDYGEALQESVRGFQERHGLEVDGLVGPKTLRALNVSVERRVDQIRLNLERARWVIDGQGGDFVLVNIAGFRAYVIRDGQTAWTTRIIVGQTEDKTPLFNSAIRHLVFNPTWTVPRSIATEEMLPIIQQDPEYLSRGGYDLLDRGGITIDPADVDWSSVTADRFPFTIVQRPGPANQLGQVKFVFPNEYSVFMHDTPAKSLFERADRACSHGCVRVDNPLGFAEVLLNEDGWTREQIDDQIESEETTTVALSEPLPILLRYWTAEVDDQDVLRFYEDIYGRDAAVLKALNEPFRPDL